MVACSLAGCGLANLSSAAGPATPEAGAEGALRASMQELVAPAGFTSGLLAPSLADAWIARATTSLEPYYSPALVADHVRGVTTVARDHQHEPSAIIERMEITSVDLGPVQLEAGSAEFQAASISYRFFLAGDEETPLGGVKMCDLRLEPSPDDGRWRVVDETCNESSG